MNLLRLKLHWQILIALLLAVVAGWVTGTDASLFGITFYSLYEFFGTLFLNALKMLIVPLIASSIITGMAGASQNAAFGRLGVKTLLYYMTTSLMAILIGLALVDMISPGIVNGEPAKEVIGLSANTDEVLAKTEGRGASDIAGIFLRMVPTNVVAAAADGQLLGLIFFCLLFGYFVTKVHDKYTMVMVDFW
ncbi:MAG: dicarboxylate/amino acid:cation symporter, partial [Gammaproteobacteria bacterium]|nr:dicarboxylate/amino acid:cation symporter [Gammaproteobacteria bacterium]